MKKLIIAAILTVASCGTAPVTAGLDKNLCEWSMTAEQSEVETQIRADIMNITKRDRPDMVKEVSDQLSSGDVMQYNYILYCDASFDNSKIVQWVTGE
ncbi:spackle periplasmic protein [Escherichia phage P896]|nr:spackle periplasmic protein [Escherichia phage P896]